MPYHTGAADKSDTPMDVAYNPTVTDPIAATQNGIGIRRPQYMLNQPRQTAPKKIHNKPGVEIWSGSPFGKSNCCPETLEKKSPCWDGYVQRGMKDQNGKMVPNCIPVEKSDNQEQDQQSQSKESWFNFRDMRPTRNEVRLGE